MCNKRLFGNSRISFMCPYCNKEHTVAKWHKQTRANLSRRITIYHRDALLCCPSCDKIVIRSEMIPIKRNAEGIITHKGWFSLYHRSQEVI